MIRRNTRSLEPPVTGAWRSHYTCAEARPAPARPGCHTHEDKWEKCCSHLYRFTKLHASRGVRQSIRRKYVFHFGAGSHSKSVSSNHTRGTAGRSTGQRDGKRTVQEQLFYFREELADDRPLVMIGDVTSRSSGVERHAELRNTTKTAIRRTKTTTNRMCLFLLRAELDPLCPCALHSVPSPKILFHH